MLDKTPGRNATERQCIAIVCSGLGGGYVIKPKKVELQKSTILPVQYAGNALAENHSSNMYSLAATHKLSAVLLLKNSVESKG